jgi:hypothetical protein
MVQHIERTLYGTPKILGRYSQLMPNTNWKLYVENSRDNYHPSLLHAFFSTFKLNRLSAEGGTRQDEKSWHHLTFTKRHTDKGDQAYDSGMIRAMKQEYGLKDPSLIDQWMEYPDQITNSIQVLPGLSCTEFARHAPGHRAASTTANWCGRCPIREDTESRPASKRGLPPGRRRHRRLRRKARRPDNFAVIEMGDIASRRAPRDLGPRPRAHGRRRP